MDDYIHGIASVVTLVFLYTAMVLSGGGAL
ncbi:hypothetical protein SAMN05421687_10834 [Salimicrobium flavidum]|uniref:Uncharacterized protein n=1 Tax=Salimicrobium flavidum TaxID=570947 RepID=A0A1N7JXU8_9BACI|nr:hypothetical protein SAMN05421687_10834 [Salimicrobium flavidum]